VKIQFNPDTLQFTYDHNLWSSAFWIFRSAPKIIVFSLVLFLSSNGKKCFAGSAGTTSFTFLKQIVPARPLGMGGAFVAVADDASTIYYNPAGLANIDKMEISATYFKSFIDTRYSCLNYMQPIDYDGIFGKGITSLGLSMIAFNGGKMDVALTNEDGTFKDNYTLTAEEDLALTLSYGELLGNFSSGMHYLGVNLSTIRSTLVEQYNAETWSSDIGWLYCSRQDNFHLGFSIRNLGPKVSYIEASESLPKTRMLGGMYKFRLNNWDIMGVLDVVKAIDSDQYYNWGFEIKPLKAIAFRFGGYNGSYNLGPLTTGFSVLTKSYQMDYAFISGHDIGEQHRITFTIKRSFMSLPTEKYIVPPKL